MKLTKHQYVVFVLGISLLLFARYSIISACITVGIT